MKAERPEPESGGRLELASDEALMQSGAAEALAELYRRHAGDLRSYLLRFEHRDATADDLVHETFVRVLTYGSSFDPGRSFRGWLFRIARNVGLATRGPAADAEKLDDLVLVAGDDPGREYRMRQALQALGEALDALSDPDRHLIVAAKLEGRSYREIGVELGITEGAVKVRVFRALNRLRSYLREQGNPGGWLDEH